MSYIVKVAKPNGDVDIAGPFPDREAAVTWAQLRMMLPEYEDCLFRITQGSAPISDARREAEYRRVGIDPDPRNRNPNGSDYHLTNAIDDKLEREQ
jgi:hypothetical protein